VDAPALEPAVEDDDDEPVAEPVVVREVHDEPDEADAPVETEAVAALDDAAITAALRELVDGHEFDRPPAPSTSAARREARADDDAGREPVVSPAARRSVPVVAIVAVVVLVALVVAGALLATHA
jgi:hypothetical protein